MKKIFFFLLTPVLYSNILVAQIPVTKQWEGIWGGTSAEFLASFQMAPDSSFFFIGVTDSDSLGILLHDWRGADDGWLLHIDKNGNYLWDKRYGGTGDDGIFSLFFTSGGYLLCGDILSDTGFYVTQYKRGLQDGWLIKTDTAGNQVWDRRYGGTSVSSSYFSTLLKTYDGGYLLAGSSNSDSANEKTANCFGGMDYWVVRTDSAGNKLWDKTFGGNNTDYLWSITVDLQNNFYLVGRSCSPVSGNKTAPQFGGCDIWLIKMDSLGNKIWDKSYGGSNFDGGRFVNLMGNNLYMSGFSDSPPDGNKTSVNHNSSSDYWVVKTDTSGTIIWDKSYGGNGNDYMTWFSEINNNQFLITGNSFSNISGEKSENNLGVKSDSWIICIDSNGNKIWDKTILNYGWNQTGIPVLVEDSCIVFAASTDTDIPGGYSDSVTYGYYDYWMVKLCGQVFTGTQEIAEQTNGINLFPNPFITTFKIQTQNLMVHKVIIKNIMGQIVFDKTVAYNNGGTIEINPGEIARGVYFVEVLTKEKVFQQKVVKQ